MTMTIMLTSFADIWQTTVAAYPLGAAEIFIRCPAPTHPSNRPLVGKLAWLVLSSPRESVLTRIEPNLQEGTNSGWSKPTEVFPAFDDIPFEHFVGNHTRVFEFSPNGSQPVRLVSSEKEITITAFIIPRRGVKENYFLGKLSLY